jgi:hypothetical protein
MYFHRLQNNRIRGIGYGLGLVLRFLPSGLQQEVFERARLSLVLASASA